MTMTEISTFLKYGHNALLEVVTGLSQREMTSVPVYDTWTVKDVLAHIIGWHRRVLTILPLILEDHAGEVTGVDVDAFNRQSLAAVHDLSPLMVLTAMKSTFQQIHNIITKLDPVEIDKRRDRNGRIITIRSYVIDIMVEHERKHALELEAWRKQQEQSIAPQAITAHLGRSRAAFMELIGQLQPDMAVSRNAVGEWSASDIVGHLADWEQHILQAATHIYDPSLSSPGDLFPLEPEETQNRKMIGLRQSKSWSENIADLQQTQKEFDLLVGKLNAGDWLLRGLYPWPNDQGTIAELVSHAAEHYDAHLADLEQWMQNI
jgi:hypothetical protein